MRFSKQLLIPRFWSSVFLLLLFAFPSLTQALDKEHILAAKRATAFVVHESGSATAFCVSEAGLFVTSDHVIENSRGREITLVLNASAEKESSYKAKVVRRDKERDLALIRIEVPDAEKLTTLPLATINELFETQELVAFGFPFGRALSTKEGAVPSISVNIGRVTSQRKKDGVLEAIQLDAQVNPGNSGGPVLDANGNVVGIISSGVRGSGVNFAIPVEHLLPLLAKPDLNVAVTEVLYADRHKPTELEATLVWLQEPPEKFELELQVTTGDEHRSIPLKSVGKGRYSASFVPIPAPPNPEVPDVFIRLTFPGGDVRGTAKSRDITVGDKTIPLAEIATITLGEEPRLRAFGSAGIDAVAGGLEELTIDLGGQSITVDGSKAEKISITPPATEVPAVSYSLVVSDGEKKEFASANGNIRVGPAPIKSDPSQGGPELAGGVEIDGVREIDIPAEIYDLDTAGNGKYLILYLREIRKLAVFDVTELKIKGYINLAEDPAVFGAGAEHVLVAYPNANLLVRYSLETLEKERTVNNTLGKVDAIGIGHSNSHHALILCGGDRSSYDRNNIRMFDLQKMAPIEIGKVEAHTFITGGSGNVLRSSADGRRYGCTKTSGSPSGVGIITYKNGKLTTRYEHDSNGTVIPNADGSLIFTTFRGVFTPDYVPVIKASGNYSSGDRFIPSYHPMYFFSVPQSDGFSSRRNETPKTIQLYIKGSNQALVSLDEPLAEMQNKSDDRSGNRQKSPLTIDKRYHFIPQLDLFLTIPAEKNKIFARSLRVHELLDRKEIDYLYVTSTPPPATAKTRYSYQLKVASRAGGIRYKLESGPDSLDVSATGMVTWIVPESAKEESVILSISDSLGQETFYTFQILVSG